MNARIALLIVLLLGLGSASAAEITAFSATADQGTPFTIVLNTTFTSSLARITNSSVACDSETACSGEVATYSLTIMDLTHSTPAQGSIDGMITGAGTVTGNVTVNVDGIPFKSVGFSGDAGLFFKQLFSTQLPTLLGSTVTVTGALDLTIPAGDSIVLPNSLDISIDSAPPTTVPEPVSMTLIGGGLLVLAAIARRRIRS